MKPKVLVAEDNIDHLELLSDALSVDNDVVGTDSFEGCMDCLYKDKYDLVVLDYNLKKNFSGFDILKEVNLKYPYLPVIMVTAYGNEDLAVKVMKIGAKDYIRKTLDNNYIERIVNNVKNLLRSIEKQDIEDVKLLILDFLVSERSRFISLWKNKIHVQEERFDVHENDSISDETLSMLFDSYVTDIKKNQVADTMSLLKDFFGKNQPGEDVFLNMELINISFKEIAYSLLSEKFPKIFDIGASIMDQISWIVDANDLVLSKEYEKAIDKSYEKIREYENERLVLSRLDVLKGELRGRLDNIGKLALSIMRAEKSAYEKSLKEICDCVNEINEILELSYKRSQDRLAQYRNMSNKEKRH